MGCGASAPIYTLRDCPSFSSPVRAAAGGDEPASKLLPQNVSMEDFQMRDIVGKGGKSIGVQIAYHMKLNRYFAVKIINEVAAEREHWEIQPRDELAALRDVTAAGVPFVVALEASYERDGKMYLVMDYMAGGELTARIHGRKMENDEAMFYAAEILVGLEGIHALGYVYRSV